MEFERQFEEKPMGVNGILLKRKKRIVCVCTRSTEIN